MQDIYIYCSVRPSGIGRTYLYIFAGEEIAIGDEVLIPFGADNSVVIGEVEEVEEYTKETVPYPIEKTKTIIGIIEDDGCCYDDEGCQVYYDDDDDDYEEVIKFAEDEEPDDEEENIVDCLIPPCIIDLDDEVSEAIDEINELIEEYELEKILDWACRYHDRNYDEEIMEKVIEAYNICIEEDYKVDIAAVNLGAIYYCGIAVKQDYKKAVEYYEIAAEAGSVRAIGNLGYCYYYGRHQEQDFEKAYEYFNMGALLNDANSLYKLGDMYLRGYSVEKNENFAFKLYSRAYEAVEYYEDIHPDIEIRLGGALLKGMGVERDLDAAMELLCNALPKLYSRRAKDPFVSSVIERCKKLISECEKEMEKTFV